MSNLNLKNGTTSSSFSANSKRIKMFVSG